MNWLDVVLLVIVAGSAASAFARGLSRELIGFVTVILALAMGAWFYGTAAFYLLPYVKTRAVGNLVGFVLIFGAIMLLGAIVQKIVKKMVKVSGLSFLDRLLGAVFGFVRGMVVAIAMVMVAMAFSPGNIPPRPIVESRLAPYVMDAARVCAAMAPFELREGFRSSYQELRSAWREGVSRATRAMPAKEKAKK
jgi:membrane protein required for colicin V production